MSTQCKSKPQETKQEQPIDYLISFDPGSQKAGWAVFELQEGTCIESACIMFPSKTSIKKRLEFLSEMLAGILAMQYIKQRNIKYLVIEDQYYDKNPDSLKKLSRFAGYIAGYINAKNPLEIYWLEPTKWKCLLFGSNKVESKTIADYYGLKSEDEAAARAIGEAFIQLVEIEGLESLEK